MLELRNIKKDYPAADGVVHALKDVSIKLRDSEFVSVLGQSGCGKTTLLNIIGGLDHYTSGDLIINGRSTKDFSDKDWDTYRNHAVGFVFQSYNLIAHQSVLANVELSLTISGVGRKERKRRAIEALRAVGLEDQITKKPNQLSGGQMQRVAIARALVNDPDIVLADEPTGALDSQTSEQVMKILKEVSRDRLVIMVTHNPDLAKEYSTRIVHLLDGCITSDSNPYDLNVAEIGEMGQDLTPRERRRAEKEARRAQKAAGKGKRRMSMATALGLSLRNLLTKKGRTILTAFAGSIGIIGIALIMSLSNGTQEFINQVEQDTLSSYPLTIQESSVDFSSLMTAMDTASDAVAPETSLTSQNQSYEDTAPDDITTNQVMTNIISRVSGGESINDLTSFRAYLESDEGEQIRDLANDIRYDYGVQLYVYSSDTSDGPLQVNPSTLLENVGISGFSSETSSTDSSSGNTLMSSVKSMMPIMSQVDVWEQLMDNEEVLSTQYELLAGRAPESYNEVVLICNKDGEVSDYLLYALGIKDQSEVSDMFDAVVDGEELEPGEADTYSFDDFLGMTFKLVLPGDRYQKNEDGTWTLAKDDDEFMTQVVENSEDITIVGIVRPSENAAISESNGAIGYRADLIEHVIEENRNTEIAQDQLNNPDIDVLTGLPFKDESASETGDASASASADAAASAGKDASSASDGEDGIVGGADAADSASDSSDGGDESASSGVDGAATSDEDGSSSSSGAATDAIRSKVTNIMSSLGGSGALSATGAQDGSGGADGETSSESGADAAAASGASGSTGSDSSSGSSEVTMDDIEAYKATLPQSSQTMMDNEISSMREQGYSDQEIASEIAAYLENMGITVPTSSDQQTQDTESEQEYSSSTLEANLEAIGVADVDSPTTIEIYAKDFASKEEITNLIDQYNSEMRANGEDEKVIEYSDYIGLMMSSVRTVIDAISYILIAFVAISLIVSSIMIGIITYISVLERTKEIGILRAIGASKGDVRRVFNAETFVIGLTAGLLGMLITMLLDLPANMIIQNITGIYDLAKLPPQAWLLVVISVLLTMLAGLIPAHIASKKDPVLALRTE